MYKQFPCSFNKLYLSTLCILELKPYVLADVKEGALPWQYSLEDYITKGFTSLHTARAGWPLTKSLGMNTLFSGQFGNSFHYTVVRSIYAYKRNISNSRAPFAQNGYLKRPKKLFFFKALTLICVHLALNYSTWSEHGDLTLDLDTLQKI